MDTEPIRAYLESRMLRPGETIPGEDAPLFSSGLIDSFGVLELIAWLEERHSIEIDTAKYHILDFDTLRKIRAIVENEVRKGGGGHGR